MSLFQKSVEKKYLSELDTSIIEKKFIEFKTYFGNPQIQENIRNSKEEQFQEGFLRELFVKILGYTLNPDPNFNLTTELKNISNAKKADGAILKGTDAIAVIELKSTDTTDLGSVESQAFGYKNHHPKCVYVITSNFEKIRFYIQNAVEYLEFDLFQLTKEQFSLLWLCLSKEKLLSDVPLKIKESSVLQEENITKKLYADYSRFREAIYNNLVKNNPDKDKLLLFKKTQKLLDRFLFIFFAEDRLLVPPNSISQIIEKWKDDMDFGDKKPLYSIFKQYFHVLNIGRPKNGIRQEIFAYNGGLFVPDEILDNISIDDEILHEHTLKLSAYDFETEVDVNILGHIFEHSLGEIENVQAEIKGEKVDQQKTRRKKDGIFYTPKYITKYIVENTVGKLCSEKRNELEIIDEEYAKGRKNRKKETIKALDEKLIAYRNWMLSLTILDPACGSGAFLNQALEFLIKEHHKIDELRAQLFGGSIIFSDITTDILEKNIFGVDLNEESVEIAKLSLWLRTAQKGRKLNALNNNIKCGNSLIDDPEVAGDKAFNWHTEFPGIFKKQDKKAWHVTFCLYASRAAAVRTEGLTPQYLKKKEPGFIAPTYPELSIAEQEILAEELYKSSKEYNLNILECNICSDHIHSIIVCQEEELSTLVGKWKGRTAFTYNRRVNPSVEDKPAMYADGTKEKFWAKSFHPVLIETPEQFENTVNYIRNNRIKHNLPLATDGLTRQLKEIVCTYEHGFRDEYNGGFDVVIGNPPYGATLSKQEKDFLKLKYRITEYNYDTYNFFFEQSINILKYNSYLGFITPNTFLVVENGILLRRFLFKENKLIELYETFDVFPDAVVEPISSIIQKKTAYEDDFFSVLLDSRDKSKFNKQFFKHKNIYRKENLIFNYRETEQENQLYLKITQVSKPLVHFAKVTAGIKPYEKGKGNPPQSLEVVEKKPFNSFDAQDNTWYKLIRGTQVNRYLIQWDGEYLKYGDWLAAPRNPVSFFKPKIVIRRTDDKLLCSFDENKYVCLNSIHCLQINSNTLNYKFLLAQINSKLCNWFFQQENFHMVGKPLAEVKVVFVERLPIFMLESEMQQIFIEKVDIMLSQNKTLQETDTKFQRSIKRKFSLDVFSRKLKEWYANSYKDFIAELGKAKIKLSLSEEAEWEDYFIQESRKAIELKSEIEKTDKELDLMVYHLYELTYEEVKIVDPDFQLSKEQYESNQLAITIKN